MTKRSKATVLAVLFLPCVGGMIAGHFAAGSRLPESLDGELSVHAGPFGLERKVDDPLLVTPERWLSLPQLREDSEILAQIEMGEGAELDLVLRSVEARELRGMTLPMNDRFHVLRLSTVQAGEPWRDELQAITGPRGGLKLGAGSRATVRVELRGREIEAVVAGKRLPIARARDDYGGMAWIARGGTVAISSLSIQPLVAGSAWLPWQVVGLAGLLIGGLGALFGASLWRGGVGATVLVVGAEAARRLAFADMPPLARPELAGELMVALAGAPLALALQLPGKAALGAAVVAMFGGVALAWLPHQELVERFPEQPELEAIFGPVSNHVLAGLAQRIPGPHAVNTLIPSEQRVFLLGGQLLYRRGAAPDEHVETLLLGELKRKYPEVEVVGLPTEDGWSSQQWRHFSACYTAYRPQVLVFGVPVEDFAEGAGGVPRSSEEQLLATLDAARVWCNGNDAQLVVLADPALAFNTAQKLAAFAGRHDDVRYLRIEGAEPLAFAQQLAEVVAPLLAR